MKITIQEANNKVTVKIEGRLIHRTAGEFDRALRELVPSLGRKKLCIDLREVTFMDGTGRHLLAEIYAKSDADFLADTPLTKYYAEEATNGARQIS
jgi:anti-anti-sigma factor